MPSSPLGDMTIIKRLVTIPTGGNCLDLDIDMDIEDSILVAAANYNGYFVYKINSKGGIISGISEQNHISADASEYDEWPDEDEMDGDLGDNRAQSVILSKEHNIAFVMDQYDHIWLYKYEEGATPYGPPNYMEEDCYGGVWLSVAIDDQPERIGIYSLLKHNAAVFTPYCIHEDTLDAIGALPSDADCSYILDKQAIEYNNQIDCEIEEGHIWMYPGCPSAEYNLSLIHI